jgi:hypothetical protein
MNVPRGNLHPYFQHLPQRGRGGLVNTVAAILPLLLLLSSTTFLVGCTVPSIQVTNEKNQTGGWIHVSGTGFRQGAILQIRADNPPGLTGSFPLGTVTASGPGGSFPVNTFQYTFNSSSNLPGCAYYSSDSVSIIISATDTSNNARALANVTVINCGW